MTIESIDPATGEIIATYAEMGGRQCEEAVEAAQQAFLEWREKPSVERAAAMRAADCILRDRGPEFARLMAAEMGKPVNDGVAEAQKCAVACDYFAEPTTTICPYKGTALTGQ